MAVLATLFLLMILGYVVLYLSGRKYLDNFEDKMPTGGTPHHKAKNILMSHDFTSPEKPYATNLLEDIDDYEVSAIHQNRGSKEASQKQLNDAMTRYPLDWAVQGSQSPMFQQEQAKYAKKGAKSVPLGVDMAHPESPNMMLPDSADREEEEKKILQTYIPKKSKDLLEYSVDDVKQLVEDVYLKRGLVPNIEKSKQGANIWEITEVNEKNPKIVWEDSDESVEDTKVRGKMLLRGEDVIEVPREARDLAAGLDPFFQSRGTVRKGKNDYTQWTPGLERMFAPTHPVKHWF
jgi:hypothetical protein